MSLLGGSLQTPEYYSAGVAHCGRGGAPSAAPPPFALAEGHDNDVFENVSMAAGCVLGGDAPNRKLRTPKSPTRRLDQQNLGCRHYAERVGRGHGAHLPTIAANGRDGWKADFRPPLVGWRLCAGTGSSPLRVLLRRMAKQELDI
jgi:hypothetical protein